MHTEEAFAAENRGIGLYRETNLHASLKSWYAKPGDRIEVRISGFYTDILRGEQCIEIQTGHFGSLTEKLSKLLSDRPVRVVYPIAVSKKIIRKHPETGETLSSTKSPKKRTVYSLFSELLRLPALACHRNFSLDVLFTVEEEERIASGKGSWRRRGAEIHDRKLIQVVDSRLFTKPEDYAALIPSGCQEPFSVASLSESALIPIIEARKMIYCLKKMGVIVETGKQGRAFVYRRSAGGIA
ncbi:MAG TPA: hypothetical protein PLG43_12445 [Spirochaetia bacterium]|nr:hypothetical protein [Spirochaetia bacterium]